MKIVCESCAAKYSIADEKVVGKVFKLRCKKCSEVMVVRGDDAADAVSRVDSIAPSAARSRNDLFAQTAARSSEREGESDDDGIFASVPSAPFAAPSLATEQQSLTGQRNEISVLFSLANLRALGTGTPAGRGAMPSHGGQPMSHLAAGEGSGLIDIRALAGAAFGGGATRSESTPRKEEPLDQLLSVGMGGSPFAPTLSAPTLTPARREASHKGLILGVGFGVVCAVAAAAIIVTVLLRRDVPAARATAPLAAQTPTLATVDLPRFGGSASADTASSTTRAGIPAPAIDSAPTRAAVAVLPATTSRRASIERRNEPARRTSVERTSEAAAVPAVTPTRPSAGQSIEAILDRVGRTDATTRQAVSAPEGAALPEQPGRDQVRAALATVQTATSACGGGQHGLATVAFTVSGATGRVSNAVVSGQFAGTPVGSCVARAARGAHLPRFRNATFSVTFPFRI